MSYIQIIRFYNNFLNFFFRDKMKSEFLVGSLASTTAQAAVYPLDRIRSVMAVSRKSQYKNMVISLQTIVNKEGIVALYRGFSPGEKNNHLSCF